MKKNSRISLALLPICLSGCSFFANQGSDYEDGVSFEKKVLPFTNYNSDYSLTATSIPLYFKDGGDLPYVEVWSFINSLEGLYQTRYLKLSTPSSRLSEVSWTQQTSLLSTTTYTLSINDKDNTITCSSMIFFDLVYSTSGTDYSYNLKTVDYTQNQGGSVTFDLGAYGIDIYRKKNEVLLPFCVANTIFCSSHYFNLHYNGSKVVASYFGLAMDENASSDLKESNVLSSGSIPEDVAKMNKANFLFVLDYFYGLRSSTYFSSHLDGATLEDLSSTSEVQAFEAMGKVLSNDIDEMHTAFDSLSFYAFDNVDHYLSFGDNRLSYLKESSNLNEAYEMAYPNDEPVRFYDDTAIVVSDYPIKTASYASTHDKNGNLLDEAYKADSFYYMKEMMNRIENRGGVKHILLDLSRNGGGNMGAVFRMLGFLTDDKINYGAYRKIDGYAYSMGLKIDVDEDGNFDDDDSYSSYSWGILTSGVTFSAANFFVCYAKAYGLAEIFGEKSGGGACPIYGFVNADGSNFHISGPSQMVIPSKDGDSYSFVSVQSGAAVDKSLDTSYFYGHDEVLDGLFESR